MSENDQLRILITPLDWGLGHTTRCVPIIHYIRQLGHCAVVACNEKQAAIIDEYFPGIEKIFVDGYNVTYSASHSFNRWKIASQAGVIANAIKSEHLWLTNNLSQIAPDGIISDNRYGMYHPDIPSVILTHQPGLRTGFGRFADAAVKKYHYQLLSLFNQVWIPDIATSPGLAGDLSHPDQLPERSQYVGWLSQFELATPTMLRSEHLLILLSGPEPQRSQLHRDLWRQCMEYNGEVVFIAGSAEAEAPQEVPEHIRYLPIASGNTLYECIAAASMVICRSGYSSLMDLLYLGKNALLIPTPGQAEQEYLATRPGWEAYFQNASREPQRAVEFAAQAISGRQPQTMPREHFYQYRTAIGNWLANLH